MTWVNAAAVWLAGFQQGDDPAGGDWPAEAIGIVIGGLVVLIAAVAIVLTLGRRDPRSDERSRDD